MRGATMILFLLVTALGVTQDLENAVCGRIIAHTPFYERILLPKGDMLRPPTLRGIDDLGPEAQYPQTNRISRVFADPFRERTNGFFESCLWEIFISDMELRCPGRLLSREQVRELLRDTVVVPRAAWTNHLGHSTTERYVFSLVSPHQKELVIDERPGACALVIFPDDTYHCVMAPGYFCLRKLQRGGSTDGSQPIRPETNRTSAADGPAR